MIYNLPPEILHDILGRLTPSWRWGWRWKERRAERANLIWFLNVRLVSKLFDEIVIDQFLAAIRARSLRRDAPLRRGPPTPSTLAMGRRLLTALVHRDRVASKYCLVNTINQAIDGTMVFFSRIGDRRDPEVLRTIYTNGMISVLTGIMGPDLILSVLDGTLDEYQELRDLDGDEDGWRAAALMTAAYLGRLQDMEKLIALGVDVNVNADPEDQWLYPPLISAAFGGQEETIRFLLDQGVDHNTRTVGGGENAMHFAALGGHTSLVQFFLDIGVESDVKNNDGDTPLLWSAGSGHADVIKLLLTQKVDVNLQDHLGRAPLIWATARGYDAAVKQLLQSKDIDVNTEDIDAEVIDVTALAVAAVMGRETIFQMLFADPRTDRERDPVFHRALIGGQLSIVKTIIDAMPGIVQDYEWGYRETALMRAAEDGSEAVVCYLLADDDTCINYQNDNGETALHVAVISEDVGKVNALLRNPKLDVNLLTTVDRDSESALHYAARGSPLDIQIVDALLKHPSIDVNIRELFGRTPLASAVLYGQTEMVKTLLKCDDVDRDPTDDWGNTPLLLAAAAGEKNMVDILLQQPNTDVCHRNSKHLTALALAAMAKHEKIVNRLLDPALGMPQHMMDEAMNVAKTKSLTSNEVVLLKKGMM